MQVYIRTYMYGMYMCKYITALPLLCRIEGVFYRIKQRLLQYKVDPVTSQVEDYIANCRVSKQYHTLLSCAYTYMHNTKALVHSVHVRM